MKKPSKKSTNSKNQIPFLLLFAALVTAILAMYTLKLFSNGSDSILGVSTKKVVPTPVKKPSLTTKPIKQSLNLFKRPEPKITEKPTPAPTKVGSTTPYVTPTRVGTSIPYLSPTPTKVGSTGPTGSLTGSDGTWCRDYGNSYLNSGSYCVDNAGVHADYCSNTTAKQYYCSGSWNGRSWSRVTCALGGYECTGFGKSCKGGGCQ